MLMKTKMSKKVLGVALSTVTSTALIAGVVATPTASARDLGQGNTFGEYGIGWDSTYTIPLASGGTVEGFCLDPFLAAPAQLPGVTYGDPVPYPIQGDAKQRMAVALYLGKIAIEQPHALDQFKQAVNFIRGLEAQVDGLNLEFLRQIGQDPNVVKAQIKNAIPPTLRNLPDVNSWDVNTVIAAASVIVHEEGSAGPEGNHRWATGNRYLTDQRAIDAYYQMNVLAGELKKLTMLPIIGPEIEKILDVDITQRKPSNWVGPNQGSQRMVAVGDLKFPSIPMLNLDFELPRVDIKPAPTPTVAPSTGRSTTTTPSEKSDTPSTTPTTPTVETTPSTTTTTTTPSSSTTTTTQPVVDPAIRTSAGTKAENVVEKGKTIVDTVVYEGLDPDTTYKLVGELVNKQTGKKTGDKGEVVFKPSRAKGEQNVEIKVNNAETSELVVFETLYIDGSNKVVARHEDINDKAQTVGKPRYAPEIRTQAESSTGNAIQTGTEIKDTVSYTGLEPGKTYRLEARLMNKADGTETGATQSVTFTPETTSGKVVVEGIKVTKPDVTEQVVFERLYDNTTGKLVASHEDITDAAQTIGVNQVEAAKKKTSKKVAPSATKSATKSTTPSGTGGAAPRQTIASVPSGGLDTFGATAFLR